MSTQRTARTARAQAIRSGTPARRGSVLALLGVPNRYSPPEKKPLGSDLGRRNSGSSRPVFQYGLELTRSVNGLLQERKQKRSANYQSHTNFGNFAHECELRARTTYLSPTLAMSKIISWRKSWNPRNHQHTSTRSEPAVARKRGKLDNTWRRTMEIVWILLTSSRPPGCPRASGSSHSSGAPRQSAASENRRV